MKSVQVPKFSRETGEAVLAHLLVNGYLQEDFHFTPYSTISYLKRGRSVDTLIHVPCIYVYIFLFECLKGLNLRLLSWSIYFLTSQLLKVFL